MLDQTRMLSDLSLGVYVEAFLLTMSVSLQGGMLSFMSGSKAFGLELGM